MTVESLVGVVGGIIGAIGGTVGIFTARRLYTRERDNFSFLARLMQKQIQVSWAGQILFEIEIGSKDWQRAEKMVENGVLARGPQGRGYRIRGFEELKPARSKYREKTGEPIEVNRNQ